MLAELNLLARLRARIRPFYDPTAWSMIAICLLISYWLDPVVPKTILSWTINFGIFAGLAVIISMHTLPQIDLGAHVKQAEAGNVASGLVVLAVCILVSALVLSITLWGHQ
jgi:hypothetical protein